MLKQDHLAVNSQLELLSQVQHWFKNFCASLTPEVGWIRDHFDPLNLALAEGFTNAVRHAHAKLPAETPIKIDIELFDDRICLDRRKPR